MGSIEVQEKTNQIDFYQLPVRAGAPQVQVGSVKLPKKTRADEASLVLDFKSNIAIILGKTPAIQSKWDRIYGYNFKTSKSYFAYSPPKGYFVDYIDISPDGKYVVFDLKASATGRSAYLVRYVIESKQGEKSSQRIKYIKF